MTIEKLIEKYSNKVNYQDILLEEYAKETQRMRKGMPSIYDSGDAISRLHKIAYTRRQAYIQTIEDLKTLK